MRSVTASCYSQKSIHSILSTLENHTSENQIDFKTSIQITRCSHTLSHCCWHFNNEKDWKVGLTPLSLISLTCRSFDLSYLFTPLHSISNHLTSLKLFKMDMQNLTAKLQEKYCYLYFWVGNILIKLITPQSIWWILSMGLILKNAIDKSSGFWGILAI